MSQSIDFRINDFINEYLDYKGFNDTVQSFSKERRARQEPIHVLTNGDRVQDNDHEQYRTIKVFHFVVVVVVVHRLIFYLNIIYFRWRC